MASSSVSSSAVQWRYDVFLSFRGEDTRTSFTDHLYAALDQKGIFTFRDDEGLERGKDIASKLFRAIEESRFSILVLSKNYAFSTWCLEELAKIVDCINEKQHTAFPVFYNVDPSEVRKQTGEFKKAFDKHEKENKEKVQRWRSAIKQVANLSGWHLQDRLESKFIQKIVIEISKKLDVAFPTNVDKDLVGIESHVEALIPHLRLLSNNVRFIGMYGMGGIGKTTLARVVYDSLSNKFDGSCFLKNVREYSERGGLIPLQKQILSEVLKRNDVNSIDVHKAIRNRLCRKKVLLVLDDVDQLGQLKELAGALEWFGHGSRIIITTRDEQLLTAHGVQYRYKVKGLNLDEARKLFYLKAFKHKQSEDGHFELLDHVIRYAQGLPLALEVLGSFLCDRSVDQWKSSLDSLKKNSKKEILNVLKVSYNGLERTEKEMFLDIACFFKGKDKDWVMKILDSCEFDPNIGITVLIEKSLITISDNKFWMHDLLQVMGWEIVRGQPSYSPGEWSRLWLANDIYRVLQENKGKDTVEGIILDKPKKETGNLNGKSFSNMSNLRLLQISNFQLSEELEYLSNELRLLDWHGYPSESFPSSFYPKNLFELNMCYSNIKYLWEGLKAFEKLKSINLSHSSKLISTPVFSEVPNLERLDLEGCTGLLEVHQSVGALRRLTLLNLKNCKNLMSLPGSVSGLKSLKFLYLCGCSKLEKLPQDLGELKCLEDLDASGTAISQVPTSIASLENLKTLSFRGCEGQPSQPWSLYFWSLLMPKRNSNSTCLLLPRLTGLSCLKTLDLGDCKLFEGAIPSDIGSLSFLEELNLSGSNIVSLPESMKQLLKLRILCLGDCQKLQSLPELPPEISFVGAENCTSLDVETLPRALNQSTSTHIALHLFNCSKLVDKHGRIDSLEVMLLKHWLQDLSSHSSQFHICLPGSKIPAWFTDWSNWYSVETQLPSSCLDELFGFAVCAVFAIPSYSYEFGPIIVNCLLSIGSMNHNFEFAIPNFVTIESDHLWLGYFSSRLFLKNNTPKIYVCATVHISSEGTMKPIGTVKRCGIRLVYKQDIRYLGSHYNCEETVTPVVGSSLSCSIPSVFSYLSVRKFKRSQPSILLPGYGCSDQHQLRWKFLELRQPPPNFKEFGNLKKLNLGFCNISDGAILGDIGSLSSLEELDLSGNNFLSLPKSIKQLLKLKILSLGYSNISDGAILGDIGSLSSLEELDLSGNNFLSLPKSVKQLLKLKILFLKNCRKLQFLPELPPEIRIVEAENCTSLDVETLSSAFKQITASHTRLHFFNCSKLVDDHDRIDRLEIMLLKRWLQQLFDRSSQFHICFQGSEIPKWFSDWTHWHSVETQLPFNRFDDLLGFAVCAVFLDPHRKLRFTPEIINFCLSIGSRDYKFEFDIPNSQFAILNSRFAIPNSRFAIPNSRITKSHLWLGFFSSNLFLKHNWQLLVVHVYATNPSFKDEIMDIDFVKKCGIRPVYKQDVGYSSSHYNVEETTIHWVPSVFRRRNIRKFERLPPMTEPRRAISPDSRRRRHK